MAKGDVVLVPFPFDDLSASKVRPAVCLTDPIGPHDHVVVAFITSRASLSLEDTDLVLVAGDEDFQTTGLKVTSVLRLHRLMTVSEAIFVRRLGCLATRKQGMVDQRLRQLFGLQDKS